MLGFNGLSVVLEIYTISWILLSIPLVQRLLGLLLVITVTGRDIFKLRRVLITVFRLFRNDFLCWLLGFLQSIVAFRVLVTLIRVLDVNLPATLGDVLSLDLVLDLGLLLLH